MDKEEGYVWVIFYVLFKLCCLTESLYFINLIGVVNGLGKCSENCW